MTDRDACGADDGAGAAPLRALAVFHGWGAGFWPRVFGRSGFRHCFVALNDGRAWVVIDPCSDGTQISAEVAAAVDLAAHYRGLGYTVVETSAGRNRRRYVLPWAFTCVEAVKRVLRVHGWWLWTPYQLYRCLEKEHGKHFQSPQAESTAAATSTADTGRPVHRRGAQARA